MKKILSIMAATVILTGCIPYQQKLVTAEHIKKANELCVSANSTVGAIDGSVQMIDKKTFNMSMDVYCANDAVFSNIKWVFKQ